MLQRLVVDYAMIAGLFKLQSGKAALSHRRQRHLGQIARNLLAWNQSRSAQ
jgi:hypothetical protein